MPQELADAIDAEVERLTRERDGEPITRSIVVRMILRRALLGAPPEPAKSPVLAKRTAKRKV